MLKIKFSKKNFYLSSLFFAFALIIILNINNIKEIRDINLKYSEAEKKSILHMEEENKKNSFLTKVDNKLKNLYTFNVSSIGFQVEHISSKIVKIEGDTLYVELYLNYNATSPKSTLYLIEILKNGSYTDSIFEINKNTISLLSKIKIGELK